MNSVWEFQTMVESCDLITCGVAARPKYVDDGIPFLSAKNVKNGEVIYEGFNCISLETHEELTKKNKPLVGDILYTRVGSYGEAAVIENDIEFSVFVSLTLIKPKRSILNSYYLRYYLNSNEVKTLAKSSITSSGVGNLNVGTVRKFPVPIPSLEEQKQIVAILDQAFAAIDQGQANIQQNIQNAQDLFQSKLNQIFSQQGEGWEEKTFKEICSIITDGTHQTPKYFDSGYIFLSSKNVTSGKIDWENVKYLDEEQHTKMYSRLSPQINDILLAKNGTTGVAAIVDVDKVFDIYVSLALLRPTEVIYPYYLLHFINSSAAKKQFNKRLKGIGVPNLHLKEIREVIINFPTSIEKQQEISAYIDKLIVQRDLVLAKYEQKQSNLEELKKSLLQKAFSGELTQNKKAA